MPCVRLRPISPTITVKTERLPRLRALTAVVARRAQDRAGAVASVGDGAASSARCQSREDDGSARDGDRRPAVHTDEELVARAAGGDRGAFAALYERYFERIFDFSLRIVRDSDTAADVVQGAFAKAWEQLSKGKEPRNFKAWLYTVARNKAIDELRHGRRQVPLEERDGDGQEIPFAHVETHQAANPQAAAQDHELADLVWSAASALKPAEYALLDMHLRQGLSAEEMAAELGVAKGNVYTRLSRLRHSLEEAVTSTLLVRRGRRECEALDALLAGFNTAELTPETRAVVQRHLEDCPDARRASAASSRPLRSLPAWACWARLQPSDPRSGSALRPH